MVSILIYRLGDLFASQLLMTERAPFNFDYIFNVPLLTHGDRMKIKMA